MTFLRPWFLILIAFPFLFKMFQKRLSSASEWYKVIDEKLLPYLLIKGTNATARQRRVFRTVLWIFLSIAMAGPCWYKMDVPVVLSKPATVIVLDLGPAMRGDLLLKARQKIYDTLSLLKGEQVALVLYDRFGYTAGPLTFETDIIRDMVPHLDIDILPSQESNPVAGFEQAERLLKNAGVKQGRILFLTSGAFLKDKLFDLARHSPHKIGVLGIGLAEPHPIPLPQGGFMTDADGKPVMISLDPQKLGQLGVYQQVTPTDEDIEFLIDETIPEDLDSGRELTQNLSLWQDMGAWFVVFSLPFFALLFRRQVAVVLLVLSLAVSAQAGWWQRPDQEAYHQQMNGVRRYWEKRYDQAEKIFQQGKTADDLYNMGNALAFQDKIDEAIEAYTQALAQDPNHEDARYNKEYLEKQKEQEEPPPEEEPEEKKEEESPPEENQEEPPPEEQPEEEQQEEPPPEEQQEEEQQPEEPPPEEQPEEEQQQDENQSEDQPEEQQQDENQSEDQPEEEQQDNNQPDDQPKEDQQQEDQPVGQEEDTTEPPPAEVTPGQEEETTPEEKEPEEIEPMLLEEEQSEEEQQPEEPIFDQESEQILNKLPSNASSVLRYRIHQQYRRYMGR